MAAFSEEFLTENYFEAILASFCCYGANSSMANEKIVMDQINYNKCSLCFIVCCIVKAYHQ